MQSAPRRVDVCPCWPYVLPRPCARFASYRAPARPCVSARARISRRPRRVRAVMTCPAEATLSSAHPRSLTRRVVPALRTRTAQASAPLVRARARACVALSLCAPFSLAHSLDRAPGTVLCAPTAPSSSAPLPR